MLLSSIPVHIGFIMDGNGRWAKAKNKDRSYGHKRGAENIAEVLTVCQDMGVKVVSLYAFSTENWSRPKDEINQIMSLLEDFLTRHTNRIIKQKVKIIISGDITKLSDKLKKQCSEVVEKTNHYTDLILNIAINYGSRQELVRAVNRLIDSGAKNINENDISNNLYTCNVPDVDLIVRTSGEQRLSNFMLYQSAYAELYFTDCLWPDFNKEQVMLALDWYANRKRRFGGV